MCGPQAQIMAQTDKCDVALLRRPGLVFLEEIPNVADNGMVSKHAAELELQ